MAYYHCLKKPLLNYHLSSNHSELVEWNELVEWKYYITTIGPKQYSFLLIPALKIGMDYLTVSIVRNSEDCAHMLTNCVCRLFFVANYEPTKWRFLVEFSNHKVNPYKPMQFDIMHAQTSHSNCMHNIIIMLWKNNSLLSV